MKIIANTLFVLVLLFINSVNAANCRSGDAAARGSQSSYEKDKQAAEQTAKNERSSSEILGKCIGGITSVITAPQFPSLSSIFDQVKNKVCQIASSQINGTVSQVNGQINQAMSGINSQVTSTGVGQVIGNNNLPQMNGPQIQQTGGSVDQSANFWSNIWK